MNVECSMITYALMLEKLDSIDHILDSLDISSIEQLSQDIEQCLEAIKAEDLQQTLPANDSKRSIVARILKKSGIIASRIQDITALHHNELNQIRLGRQTAKGYAAQRPSRTGSIINSSK
ncbi:hypothetical protein [uncultured Desulfobulbus sp.]|uniref:hypothetical protein n=1 Tax=uncultured Desulfobulbus sp. TaxID=239745 RepID=UPI0029C83002|nr:hypothetical protein [uncultured Desulfobulbus sp.]